MQASSLDQLASGLTQVLQDGLKQAADQASSAPDRFADIIKQAIDQAAQTADQIKQIPEDLWQKLKDSAEHPDWLGLMLFLACQLRDAVGDPPLRVGAYDPGDGWSRALILIYTQTVVAQDDTHFSLSIALGGEGKNGIIVDILGEPHLDLPAGPLSIGAQGSGTGTWRFPFSGGGAGPHAGAKMGLSVGLAQPVLPGSGDVSLAIGKPRVGGNAEVGTDTTLAWAADVSFGTPAEPGLEAKLNLASFLGVLASVVNIQPLDERYSPSFRMSSTKAPAFDLGHQGA